MANQFGHGFITSIMLIAKHFALPPDQAWHGAGDHVEGLTLPGEVPRNRSRRTHHAARKKVIWHQPGTMDKEDAHEVIRTLDRLVVAIDHELGIKDAVIGEFR